MKEISGLEMVLTEQENGSGGEKIPAEKLAYDTIKTNILTLKLKPGQFVSDLEIATELNLSRTPVRDALRRLEFEGLVNSQSRKGWQVSPLTLEDIREIFTLKCVLQSLLARQAAACRDETLRAALAEELQRMQQCNDAKDQPGWEKAHVAFHQTLLEMTGKPNGRTARMVDNLNDQWRRLRVGLYAIEGYRQREMKDHIEIGNAILAQDEDGAAALMEKHLERVKDEILHLLSNLVFPFAPNGI